MKRKKPFVLFCLVLVALLSALPSVTANVKSKATGQTEEKQKKLYRHARVAKSTPAQYGKASWYGPRFFGNKKANGKKYRRADFHVAHKTIPLGTSVRITNLTNRKTVVAVVEDRGPYSGGRIIDASEKVALALGFIKDGFTDVRVDILSLR